MRTDVWYYIIREGMAPYVTFIKKWEDVLLVKPFQCHVESGIVNMIRNGIPKLQDPFTVVDYTGAVVLKITEPSEIAIITAHLLTLYEKPSGLTQQDLLEFIADLKPEKPTYHIDVFTGTYTALDFNEQLKQWDNGK